MSKYLPQELVEQILFKLQVKSLLRFSSASKEWYKLVNKPKPLENSRSQFLLGFYLEKGEYIFYSDKDGEFKEYAKFKVQDYLRTSSNGIICFSDYMGCGILWNPSIRRHLRLPRADHLIAFGVVVDHIKNEYKVLGTDNGGQTLKIFRTSTGTWEPMEFGVAFFQMQGCQVDLEGKSYWIALNFDERLIIVSFDAHKETWGVVKLPMPLVSDDQTSWIDDMEVYLFSLENSLVLVHMDFSEEDSDENHADSDEDHEDDEDYKDSVEDHEDSVEDHEDSNEDHADSVEDHEDSDEDSSEDHENSDEDHDVDTRPVITYKMWKMEDSEGTSWKLLRKVCFRERMEALGFRGNGEFLWAGETSKVLFSTYLEKGRPKAFGRYNGAERIHSCPNYVESLALLDVARKESAPPSLWERFCNFNQ